VIDIYNLTTITSISTTGSSAGGSDDPHFVGFNNQEFLFHGTSNDIYNIISEKEFQFNAKFKHYNSKYLADYSTWFSEFGLKIGKNNKIYINSSCNFELNEKIIKIGEKIDFIENEIYFSLNHYSECDLNLKTKLFELNFFVNKIGHSEWCSEGCPHIDFNANIIDSDEIYKIHGILGQTIKNITYVHNIGYEYIEGKPQDYKEKSGNLFGDKFKFNQFQN